MAAAEQAFLEEIKTDTESDDTREVYADWLEEQGFPERAEHLRLEAEVRRFDFITGSPEREAKQDRHEELTKSLAKNDLEWLLRVRRKPRPPIKLPRPTDLGVAELILPRPKEPPVRDAKAESRALVALLQPPDLSGTPDLYRMPSPLEVRVPPPLPVATGSWWPSIVIGILVGIAIILFIEDVQKPHFWSRLIERIYENGRF